MTSTECVKVPPPSEVVVYENVINLILGTPATAAQIAEMNTHFEHFGLRLIPLERVDL